MRLVSIDIEGFMAYTKQRIDFDESGCYVITGENLDRGGKSNGAGKSSIFWAIVMALYNQARGKTLGESIKIGSKSCSLELILENNGKYYKIQRKRRRDGTSTTFLWMADNVNFNNAKDITGHDQNDTQSKINSLLKMDYQAFCHSVYFKEDASSIFAQSSKSVRFNIIKNSLQVDKYDKYAKEARKDLEQLNSEIMSLSSEVTRAEEWRKLYEQMCININTMNSQLSSLGVELASLDKRLTAINAEEASLDMNLAEIRSAENYKQSLVSIISDIDKQILSAQKQITKTNNDVSANTREIGLLREQRESLLLQKKSIRVLSETELEAIDEETNKIRGQILLNNTKIQEMEEKIKAMSSIDGSVSQCWACGKPLSDDEREKILTESKSVISMLRDANKTLGESLEKIRWLIKKNHENKSKILYLDSEISKCNSKITSLSDMTSQLNKMVANIHVEELVDSKSNYVQKLDECNQNIQNLKDRVGHLLERRESIGNEKISLTTKKNSILGEIASINQQIGKEKSKSAEILPMLESIEEEENRLALLWDKKTIVENFISACSKKGGIPSILISSAVCEIEKFANDMLCKFDNYDGMQIKLLLDRPDEIDIMVRMGSEVGYRDFDTFSGGERFIISFAIRMALAQVLSKKYGANIKFILLDEAGAALDEYNTSRFVEMVKKLSKDTLILLITHQNNLKELIQQNISVTRKGGKSVVLINGNAVKSEESSECAEGE